MKLLLAFMSLALVLELYAADNIWSQDTKAVSEQEEQAAMRAYGKDRNISITFDDDPVVKDVSDIEDNLLVVGLLLGYGSSSETVSNTTGSYSIDHSLSNFRVIIGKDFTFWHEEYTEPTRIYLALSYTALSTGVNYNSWGIGIKESMRYWSLYDTKNYTIYPTLFYEVGDSSLTRGDQSISGLTSEFGASIVYERSYFEYEFAVAYNSISWDHPVDGIKDESTGFKAYLGVNYRWMYDD